MVTTMNDVWSSRTLAAVLTLVCLATVDAGCPHTDAGLKRWSDASTWGGTKPGGGQQVTLTSGMHVLLDESTPSLGSITVESGATLVWDDKADITLTVSYVLVRGEFHVGSDDCRFTKKANIVLTGLSNSTLNVPGFGRKFIGVAAGGVLELHGREKTSWTKLATSIPAADQTCGVVYDHKNTPYHVESGMGIHVVVWNLDGSLYDFGTFFTGETWNTAADSMFVEFLRTIPTDKVVALSVMRKLGVEARPDWDWESIFTAVETLGGLTQSHMRNVSDTEPYAFITVTGNPGVTMEQRVAQHGYAKYTITDDVHITLWGSKLKFFVESAVRIENNWRLPHDVNFRVTSTDIAYPKVDVINDVSTWQPGDRVVFTSTDFDWKQAEEFEVFACDDCASNQFRVKGEFKFPHYGKVYDGVDMRGEVALLSRDVVIEGEMETGCYVTETNRKKEEWLCSLFDFDHFGGHLKVTKGFKSAHIQGIEFYHMGQQEFTGSYPIHFHMCDDVNGTWVRSNSIHHSLARCVTIHGTDGLEVSDNACYDHLGHGYFLEDSVEQYNILDGNIGIGTKHGTHIMTDMKNNWCDKTLAWSCNSLATFWITHFNNYIRNNVAAGSDNAGFWLNYADSPLGPSAARQAEKLANNQPAVTEFSTRHTPILEFDNNVAHSNHERGLMFDNRISNGQIHHNTFIPENARFGSSEYDPREPNTPEGEPVTTSIKRLTVFKNRKENIWLRAANTILVNCSIADSQRGLVMPLSKSNRFNEVRNSVFIGMSDNMGVGRTYTIGDFTGPVKPIHKFSRSFLGWRPTDPLQGFVFYNGPNYVTDCYFNDFYNWHWNSTWDSVFNVPGYRTGGALGFKRTNMLLFSPRSTVSGLKFGFCDKSEGNTVFDGNKTTPGFEDDGEGKEQASLHDVDGSVTGMINSQVVKNNPFFTTPKCSVRDNWGMAVCPYKYVKIDIRSDVWKIRNDEPVTFIRDDAHQHPFAMNKDQGRRYHFMVNKTYTVHFNTTVPKQFMIQAFNMESGDSIRVGVCMPKDMTTFELSSWYPSYNKRRPPLEVATIQELDADTSGRAYFWDKQVGMIFVKLMSNETRTERQMLCPNGKCPNFNIVRKDGGNTADCRQTAYGPYVKQPEVSTGYIPPSPCAKASSQGFGAGDTRPTTILTSSTSEDPYCPPQTEPAPEPLLGQSRGCAVDTWRRDMGDMTIRLYRSMTRGFCVQRCGQNGYRYAGLQNSNECWCGNSFGLYGSGEGCTKECSAKTGRSCGGGGRNEVFTTSAVRSTTLTSCGPGSRGVVIDGSCYYFGDDRLNFVDAQRACVKMGGDLASIPSAAVQSEIKAYLGQSESNIWIGLTDVAKEGEFIFMDGTPATYINGDLKHDAAIQYDDFVAIDVYQGLIWDYRRSHYEYRYICQMPIASSTVFESCGPNGAGHRLGSNGKCYLILNTKTDHDTAEYQCLTRQGVLPTVTDDVTQREIRNQLLIFGRDMDYWTGEMVISQTGAAMDIYHKLTYATLFNKNAASPSEKNGVLCLIEEPPSTSNCPPTWKEHNGSCYLYTGKAAPSYDTVAALCNQGDSNMMTVHSKAENDFVYNMVKDFHKGEEKDVLIGYRYRSVFDKFTWLDGSDPVYENWSDGHGMSGLTGGYCTKICFYDNKVTWKNTPCLKQNHAAVCKMPL